MATRIYLVGPKNGATGRKRLVRASGPGAALRHVVEDTLEVRFASQDDIVDTMASQDPCSIEVAGEAAENPSN